MANRSNHAVSPPGKMIRSSSNARWVSIARNKVIWNINLQCRLKVSWKMMQSDQWITVRCLGVVPPEELQSTRQHFQNLLNDERLLPQLRPFVEIALEMPARIDIRHCNPRDILRPVPEWPARQFIWVKAIDPLPDDSHLHRSAVAFCSDRVLLTTAFLPYRLNVFSPRIRMQASLDHSMWFHDDFSFSPNNASAVPEDWKPIRRSEKIPPIPAKTPVRADDWLLYELECPVAMGNRALTFGRIWTRQGRLIVSCAQEGVIRCAWPSVLTERIYSSQSWSDRYFFTGWENKINDLCVIKTICESFFYSIRHSIRKISTYLFRHKK